MRVQGDYKIEIRTNRVALENPYPSRLGNLRVSIPYKTQLWLSYNFCLRKQEGKIHILGDLGYCLSVYFLNVKKESAEI